jgi:hypothetical protein
LFFCVIKPFTYDDDTPARETYSKIKKKLQVTIKVDFYSQIKKKHIYNRLRFKKSETMKSERRKFFEKFLNTIAEHNSHFSKQIKVFKKNSLSLSKCPTFFKTKIVLKD